MSPKFISLYYIMSSKHSCEKCDYVCSKLSDWEKHLKTNKHNSDAIRSKFECCACNYVCYAESIMDKHKKTNKHKLKETEPSSIQEPKFAKESDMMTVITQLLNQNSELKNFIIEQANEHKNFVIEQANEHKKETLEIVNKVIDQSKTINNNITNNSNNKAFNINLFLNEQCKDAMNFSDFIDSIEVSHEDLENNAQLGFMGGISKIILDGLKGMNQNERPIHCTDVKRETMYIKDDNKWNKEENDSKLRNAIQTVTRKSMGTLQHWKQDNPDYKNLNSEFSNRCITIQRSSMAGSDREVYYPKVIHAIAREVLVSR